MSSRNTFRIHSSQPPADGSLPNLVPSSGLLPSNQIPNPESCSAKAQALNSIFHTAAAGSAVSAAPQGSGVICGIKVCSRMHTCSVLVRAGFGALTPLPAFPSVLSQSPPSVPGKSWSSSLAQWLPLSQMALLLEFAKYLRKVSCLLIYPG